MLREAKLSFIGKEKIPAGLKCKQNRGRKSRQNERMRVGRMKGGK
jgi:hypothetical protein